MKNITPNQLKKTLKTKFNFNDFRPGQLDILILLMKQNRVLAIQPTGHGKSLLYQLPTVLLEGITLVISPLLALMRDQIQQLKTRFHIPAASINTDQSEAENEKAKYAAMAGNIKVLFIAPEQLDRLDKFNFLLTLPVTLFVIDEAHCISMWGHDFRPSYRLIINLLDKLMEKNPHVKVLGLTATANLKTEKDIKKQLTVANQTIITYRASMDRSNLHLSVIPVTGVSAKLAKLKHLLTTLSGSGLIYCATREHTQIVASYLQEHHIHAMSYHAGMTIQQKRLLQDAFMSGTYSIIAATNALGMGIDKSNIRFVIHFDYPVSVTAYYQEVGRAGRDGLPAKGILLYDGANNKIQRHFIASSQLNLSDFQYVLESIGKESFSTIATLKFSTGMHSTQLLVIIAELIEQKLIRKNIHNTKQIYTLGENRGVPNLRRFTERLHLKKSELHVMQQYAEQKRICLMKILRYELGDKNIKTCGNCDVCSKKQIWPIQRIGEFILNILFPYYRK